MKAEGSWVAEERGWFTSQPALLTRMSMAGPWWLRVWVRIVKGAVRERRSARMDVAGGEEEVMVVEWLGREEIWVMRSLTREALEGEV